MEQTNTLFRAMIIAMVAIIGMTGFAAATYDSSVVLENKDSNWGVIIDDISATIEYNSVGEEFAWHASGTATLPNTEYSLIYYADYPHRFNKWGGDNPGALIGTMTTDVDGDFDGHGYTELGMDLPSTPDVNMNISEHNYCGAPDNYDHCTGAKLWIVPSDDYDAINLKVNKWNPVQWLFETDLITYVDCDDYYTQDVPANATFSIGDAFNVDTIPIMVLNATNAGSVDMTLAYNASLVTVTGVSSGDMDNDFWNIENAGDGWIRIGAYQSSNPGLDGDFVIAYVSFEQVSDGMCDFGITVTTYKDATPCGRSMPYVVSTGVYSSYLNGDVNGDGIVDMFDAMYLAKYSIGISGFGDIIEQVADVDGSGNIDIADASYLAKHILEIDGYEDLK